MIKNDFVYVIVHGFGGHPSDVVGIKRELVKNGMKEKDIHQIAEWIERIVLDIENEITILKVKNEVNEYMKQFPLY